MPTRYQPALDLARRFLQERLVSRIWDRDIGAWGAAPGSADAKSIATRLGWLDIAETMRPHLERVDALGESARAEKIEAVYLLGMGGSSLCAEVLRVRPRRRRRGSPALRPRHDRRADTPHSGSPHDARPDAGSSSPARAAARSKSLRWSGFFWSRLSHALGRARRPPLHRDHGSGTALEALAGSRGYREVFINPPDIGGRFSALSLFGLVPAALIGALGRRPALGRRNDGRRLPAGEPHQSWSRARRLHRRRGGERARQAHGGPAAVARHARSLDRAADRREHRQARQGRAAGRRRSRWGDPTSTAPIARSSPSRPIGTTVDAHRLAALEAAGHPVLRLSTRLDALGAEFFRWEFATAVAGAALGINPFDEPNVSEAKEKTKALLGALRRTGRACRNRLRPHRRNASTSSARTSPAARPSAVVRAALASLAPPDYVAFLSYLPPDSDIAQAVGDIRAGHPQPLSRRQHVRRRPALPSLDRAVPQGRTEHRARVRPHRGR